MQTSAWQPFARREFRAVWVSTLVVHLVNWMHQVGAASLMATLTPSPTMVALVQTAASLPAVLLGLPAGALADRVERRQWLIFTQLWLCCGTAIVAAAIAWGGVGPWSLLALTMLIGAGFALQMPASQAVIGEVVPRVELPAALVLAGLSFNISRVAGPFLAGVLIGVAGGASVYAALCLCSVGVLVFLVRWPGVPRAGDRPPERLWPALLTGVRYVRQAPQSRVALMHTLVFMSCGSAAWALLPVVARDSYGLGAGGYGMMLGALGAGGVLGAFLMPPMRRRWSAHAVIALCALVFAAVTGLLALAVPLPVALGALVLGGTVWMGGASAIYAALQASLPGWVRARGLSIYNLVYFLAMAGGAAAWGACAGAWGTPAALIASAAAMSLAAPWLYRQPFAKSGDDAARLQDTLSQENL